MAVRAKFISITSWADSILALDVNGVLWLLTLNRDTNKWSWQEMVVS